MLLQQILSPLALLPFTLSAPFPLDSQAPLFSSTDLQPKSRVPTRYESTILGRRLLALSSNHSQSSPWTPPPSSVSSLSISLPDYLADCDSPSVGNPTLLFLDPSTSSRNSRVLPDQDPAHANNISLSLSWWDVYPLLTGHRPWAPADLPRLSMIGYLEEMSIRDAEETGVVACYLRRHPDARLWLPGDEHAAHTGRWVRLVVREVYWMGGFGDRHWIGWFDREEWNAVREGEWGAVRLPGEKD